MRFIYSFLTLILLLSCSDSNEYEPEISHAKTQISFSVTTEALSDSTQSRGITQRIENRYNWIQLNIKDINDLANLAV